jgi:phosphoglycerate dehydrogenase-like enzyme
MHIVVLEPLGIRNAELQALASTFTDRGHQFTSYDARPSSTKELINRVKDADVLILANMPLPKEAIEAAGKLKLISVAFTGVDHIDMKTCREKNIMVCNAAGYSTYSVAELSIGLIISVLRNIVPCDAATRNSKTKDGLSQHEVFGKTIGIIGTGAIGMRVAEIAQVFGCKVLAYSRTRKTEASSKGIQYVELDELLSQSDIVSLHVPLTEATTGLINSSKLDLMKPSAILINTARGAVVDNVALAEALKNGKIAGAGLDVFEVEPPLPENHPLFDVPNAVLTPHIAFATAEAIFRRAEIVFENIDLWEKGKPRNIM